jgi:hypothetical protein
MPPFLVSIGAAFAANALKLGLGLLLLALAVGGGFVWGDSHATSIATEAAAKDADARVVAVQKAYQSTISDYQGKLIAQNARGDALSAQLADDQNQLAVLTAKAKQQISHAIPPDSACDLPADVTRLLNGQPARQSSNQ